MKKVLILLFLFSFLMPASLLRAQIAPLVPADPDYARLRGITYFYIDVTSSENTGTESELRNELRDLIELELRRASITIRNFSPTETEDVTPVLHLNLKFDRGMGRYACTLELSVRDKVNITRNKEQITATTFEIKRPVSSSSDQLLARDVKNRTRDLITEFIRGLRRP